MTNPLPSRPPQSFRITLELKYPESRMDNLLLAALREQNENAKLKVISRTQLKELFLNKKIQIKGQRARPNSALAAGVTYVDVLGF